jgi:hypothetical protein
MANPIGSVLKHFPMEMAFSKPFMAAIDCQTAASQKYAEFIEKVGLNDDGTVKMSRFKYASSEVDDEGNATGKTINRVVDVPFFSLIDNGPFGMDKVTVDFEFEASTSEQSSSSTQSQASISGKLGFAWWSVKISGSVTHKSEQTRKTDTRAKYTVHMEGSNQGASEGLKRVFDMMMNSQTKPIEESKAPKLAAPAPAK